MPGEDKRLELTEEQFTIIYDSLDKLSEALDLCGEYLERNKRVVILTKGQQLLRILYKAADELSDKIVMENRPMEQSNDKTAPTETIGKRYRQGYAHREDQADEAGC